MSRLFSVLARCALPALALAVAQGCTPSDDDDDNNTSSSSSGGSSSSSSGSHSHGGSSSGMSMGGSSGMSMVSSGMSMGSSSMSMGGSSGMSMGSSSMSMGGSSSMSMGGSSSMSMGGSSSMGTSSSGPGRAMLSINGSYTDNWNTAHTIAQDTWVMTFSGASPTTFTIHEYHNDADFLVAQNDPADPYNPSMWSRIDWTYDATGALWYCQIVFNAADQATAAANTSAVRTDPGASGCGSFAWNRLANPADLEIIGSYVDNWASTHAIAQNAWVMTFSGASPTTFTITQVHNNAEYLVAQNDPTDPYNPSKWSRFDWTYDAAGALWYCQIIFDAADEATAAGTTTAVRTDPGMSGCGSFGWNNLTP